MLPDYIANLYWAEINGISEKLLDYYVEITDAKGNMTKTKIQHVWVGKNLDVAPKINFTPENNYSASALDVTITATDSNDANPTLYYTIDGSTPTQTSTSAVKTVTINLTQTTTIKVFAKDADGNLSGWAWSENFGWISFNCSTGGSDGGNICASSNYKVTVNQTTGEFDGYAWSQNLGWISFNCATGGVGQTNICSTSNYKVRKL